MKVKRMPSSLVDEAISVAVVFHVACFVCAAEVAKISKPNINFVYLEEHMATFGQGHDRSRQRCHFSTE